MHAIDALDAANDGGVAPRVLTFLHSFEPGGVERIALRLVRRWRELGVHAPLYLGRTDGAMAADVGLGMEFLSPRRRPGWAESFETAWMIATLPAVIRRERPDALFCAGNTYAVVAVAMKVLLGGDCPPILAKISNDLDRRDKPWPARLTYHLWLILLGRMIDRVVGMEDAARDEIRERLRLRPDRIGIVPDPALSRGTIERARGLVRPLRNGRGRRFVAVGRLVRQKRLDVMLHAFQLGSRSEDRLSVLGDGPERRRLAALAERLGIADRVTFFGYVSSPQSMLFDFDVLLLSSDYEGVPAVVLEALAAGLEVVATDCSRSMKPLLKEGRLHELVPVSDRKAMADAIARAQPGRHDPKAAFEQVERFTIEGAAVSYLAEFIELRSSAREAVRAQRNDASAMPVGHVSAGLGRR